MRINKLIIKALQENILGTAVTELEFERVNLITSDINGSGKTSLIRFLLYSMGFKIPSTKGFDMEEYSTTLYLSYDKSIRCVKRIKDDLTIDFDGTTQINFNLHLDEERWKAIATILEVDNVAVIPFLLGTFYMDQDKGWGLFNRGKIIGENSFFIEPFILALKNKENRLETYSRKKKLDGEIKRYSSILNVYQLDTIMEENKPISQKNDLANEMLLQKSIINYDISQVNKQIKDWEKIVSDNDHLVSTIENFKLLISFEGKEFVLKKSHIKDFEANQHLLKAEMRSLEIEKANLVEQLDILQLQIDESEAFLPLEDISNEVIKQVKMIQLNEIRLNELVEKKKRELSNIRKLKKEFICKEASDIYSFLSNRIKKYAEELDVFRKIDDEKDYVLTRNLKAHSGVSLHKLALSYKLSYYDCLKEFLNIEVPFILDSPGSGEATESNVELMIKTVCDNIPDNQIIIASVVKGVSKFVDKKIVIKERLMDSSIY